MDRISKAFFIIFFATAGIAAVVSFYRFYILKDYYIAFEVECDPAAEQCLVYECDPEIDTLCPQNPDERISYYKLIEKKAYALQECDEDAGCPSPETLNQ